MLVLKGILWNSYLIKTWATIKTQPVLLYSNYFPCNNKHQWNIYLWCLIIMRRIKEGPEFTPVLALPPAFSILRSSNDLIFCFTANILKFLKWEFPQLKNNLASALLSFLLLFTIPLSSSQVISRSVVLILPLLLFFLWIICTTSFFLCLAVISYICNLYFFISVFLLAIDVLRSKNKTMLFINLFRS